MNINPLTDNHLKAASFSTEGVTTILITDVCEDKTETSRDYHQLETAKFGQFGSLIADTLQEQHGSVLIPVDSAGRCLEVLLLLERVWEEKHLDSFKVYFLTKRNSQLLAHVRGITSNMNDRLQAVAAKAEREAFDLRHVTCVPVVENVLDSRGCKVVVASLPGLETSFSQILLTKWCAKSENLLLFVETPAPGTLADALLHRQNEKRFKFIVGVLDRCHVESKEDSADGCGAGGQAGRAGKAGEAAWEKGRDNTVEKEEKKVKASTEQDLLRAMDANDSDSFEEPIDNHSDKLQHAL